MIKMKTASMFHRVVASFLLYPMLFYIGKFETKLYVYIFYWSIMIPVLYNMVSQIKDGYTINKTRIVCTGLCVRMLVSNFDFEGKAADY